VGSTYVFASPEELAASGIADGLVRVSAGIED
jgi:cystathionine beta-lyase/cystathionine gamma-synthase